MSAVTRDPTSTRRASGLSRLKIVRIGRPVSHAELAILGEQVLRPFARRLRSVRLLDYRSPGVERIEADLLTQALDQDVGGHILGVTDADLLDVSGGEFFPFMFGCKDRRNDVAVVSTRRLAALDPGRTLARLLKVALHELGHNFGLVHHYAFVPAIDGAYCPMTKGDYNRHGERSYRRAVIDARGRRFCSRCSRFLRLTGAEPTQPAPA